jgi:hypothetical protein
MSRPRPTQELINELRNDLEELRFSQDRMMYVSRLRAAMAGRGVDVLWYEGPARYELDREVECELCNEPLSVLEVGYELWLSSEAWGPRYGYVHKGCFDRLARGEQ